MPSSSSSKHHSIAKLNFAITIFGISNIILSMHLVRMSKRINSLEKKLEKKIKDIKSKIQSKS
jgi:predicted Holliday junction resolvase-like endonuclease